MRWPVEPWSISGIAISSPFDRLGVRIWLRASLDSGGMVVSEPRDRRKFAERARSQVVLTLSLSKGGEHLAVVQE